MAHRKIELDEDANEILDSMANAYGGDANLAISELLRAHETIESFLDVLETHQATELAAQKDRAERGFREGRLVVVIDSEVKCVLRHHPKHEPVAEHAGLAEHASHCDVTERGELLAEKLGEAIAGDHPPSPS